MIITEDPEAIRRVLLGSKTVAVVGASPKPERDSYQIARHLIDLGYDVIPVNPGASEILGRKCYPDLKSIPKKIDIVDVFRAPEHVPPVAEEAILVKAECLWLQSGIVHDPAAQKASDAGLYVVQDRCIATLHRILVRR
ncbi:MAG TPA: CoA-binding protein [Planctomycetota bacterium]|nr:CoA-binding protein [Planctomycetota bacterium]